jgi:hypothetical protein
MVNVSFTIIVDTLLVVSVLAFGAWTVLDMIPARRATVGAQVSGKDYEPFAGAPKSRSARRTPLIASMRASNRDICSIPEVSNVA